MSRRRIITIAGLVVVLFIAGGYFFYRSYPTPTESQTPQPGVTGGVGVPTSEPSGDQSPQPTQPIAIQTFAPVVLRGIVQNIDVNARTSSVQSGGGNYHLSITREAQIFDVYANRADINAIKQNDLVDVQGRPMGGSDIVAYQIRALDTDSRFEITQFDTGKTFVYNTDEQFTVILNKQAFPSDKLSCNLAGLLKKTNGQPSAGDPMFAQKFAPLKMGHCKLTDGSFSVDIQVSNKDEM